MTVFVPMLAIVWRLLAEEELLTQQLSGYPGRSRGCAPRRSAGLVRVPGQQCADWSLPITARRTGSANSGRQLT